MQALKFKSLLEADPVVVTGMGAHCAAGSSVPALWNSAVEGISPAAWFSESLPLGIPRLPACAAPPINTVHPAFRLAKRMDRSVQLALAASLEAWANAGLDRNPVEPQRIGILTGTSRGPLESWTRALESHRAGRVLPTHAANSTLACISGMLSIALQTHGPALTVSAACASGAAAIAMGAQFIATGAADIVIAGGTEASLQPAVMAQLHASGILGNSADPREACRPFDLNRNGTVIGEGAGFLVLESLSSARRRKVPIHAVLAGWAAGSDAHGRAAGLESGEGLARVMNDALQIAGISPKKIGYINAHGTGTRLNDQLEANALAMVFGDRAGLVPCSSTKPVTGHCLGASSAIEAIISIEALKRQLLPPTINHLQPDPSCPLDVVPGTARPAQLRAVMSNSSGFWSNHASLVFALAD